MTLIELRDKANAKLATLWTVIQAKEDAYFAKHGTYFGLRWSPSSPVVDGVDTDLILDKPSRGNFLEDINFDLEQVPFQLSIERIGQNKPRNSTPWIDRTQPEPTPTYIDNGDSYKAWIRIQLLNGDIWMRSRTKDNTDSGWFKFEPKV